MIEIWPPQDPDSRLDYQFDMRPAIAEQNSPLLSYEIRIRGTDDALIKSDEVLSDGVVYFWLESPTEGGKYTVTCHFELVNGYRDDMSNRLIGEQT
jgi:hypothetical protein